MTIDDVEPQEVFEPLELKVALPETQRRLTVAFRAILVIPQLVVISLIGIAAGFALLFGWFAALFTGRLPEGIATFLTGYIRWTTRVSAYLYLLTDRYPPFSLEPDERYPVDIEVSNDRLNRWAVFFRLVLVIPAVVVVTLLSLGLGVLLVVNWFVTLIMGRQPRSFFEAYGALLRYATRLNAYYYLLTSFYPFGLAGDREAASDGESPPPPALDTPPVGPPESDADAESEGDTAVADLAKVGPDGVTPAPSGSDAPVLPPPPPMLDASPPWTAPSWDVVRRPPGWSFVMGTGGRIVLVVAIVLGLGYGAFLGFAISRIHLNQSLFAQSDASSAYQGLVSEISAFGTAQDQCLKDDATESTQQVACVEGNYRTLADQVANYQSTLSEIEFPSSASSQAVAAQSAASALTQALRRVAAGGSTYQDLSNAVAQANLSEASQQVALTYTQLNQALQ